jgi:lipopolysaccharide heptosyltransferase II
LAKGWSMNTLPTAPKRILVIDLALIGDLVCATPALAALRAAYPAAELCVMAASGAAPVLAHHPHISRLVRVDKRAIHRSMSAVLAAARQVRRLDCELVVLFHNSLVSAVIGFLARVPSRAGYTTDLRGPLLTHRLPPPARRLHLVDQRLELLRRLGLHAEDTEPVYYVNHAAADATALALLPGWSRDLPLLVLAVGASWPTKQWPRERMQALCRKLPPAGCALALVGAPGQEQLAEGITSASVPVFNLVGKTDIEQLGHILALATAVVTPDSGPMHMAAGLGKPVVALFGPTDVALCGMRHRLGVHLLPPTPCRCYWKKRCTAEAFCMSEITEDMVLDAVLPCLAAAGDR